MLSSNISSSITYSPMPILDFIRAIQFQSSFLITTLVHAQTKELNSRDEVRSVAAFDIKATFIHMGHQEKWNQWEIILAVWIVVVIGGQSSETQCNITQLLSKSINPRLHVARPKQQGMRDKGQVKNHSTEQPGSTHHQKEKVLPSTLDIQFHDHYPVAHNQHPGIIDDQ